YYVWLHRDPHARAYEALFDERSAAMVASLAPAGERPRAAFETPACLACHSLAAPPRSQAGPAGAAASFAPIDPLDGVSCEACHGPASGWRGGHSAEDWPRERSLAAGLVDLEDPEVRARVCLGCHLGTGGGSPARLVDHDLIAAGHPPLLFELDNYGQTMPPHWRGGPGDGVRAWAVGQAVAFEVGLEELARRARQGPWPDFSFLSCYACHHELGDERFRTRPAAAGDRPYRDRIGMPPWSPARWAVLRVLVERHAPAELAPLDAEVARLARQVSRLSTPPAEVAAGADALGRRLEPVVSRLGRVPWDAAETRAVLLAITGQRDELAAADVHSAEQAALALYSLAGFLLAEEPGLAAGGTVESLAALSRELQEPREFDRERFRRALAEVEERLRRRRAEGGM
ncbi:MAG TPA: multiheme c-type cytochrome, partial [Thermoanaerobaculia bacterium]|nr:multiheme c-type cytochrome [Thermoanaerobaculia bacterium]